MVVYEHEGRGVELERAHDDVAGIRLDVADGARAVKLEGDRPVADIEIEDVQFLVRLVRDERPAVFDHGLVVVEHRVDGVGKARGRMPDGEGFGDFDGDDGVIVDAGDGPEPSGGGGKDAGRVAEDGQQVSVLGLSDGALIGLSEGFDCRLRRMVAGVPDGRRRVKRLRRSSASLRPFG